MGSVIRRVLLGLAALPFLACVTLAAQPLTDQQMDGVTAGAIAANILFVTVPTGDLLVVTPSATIDLTNGSMRLGWITLY